MTRADRLNALIRRVAPKKQAFRDANGVWPTEDELETGKLVMQADGTAVPSPTRGIPYEIRTVGDNKRKILITDDEGSTTAAIGDNIEDALKKLEAKIA